MFVKRPNKSLSPTLALIALLGSSVVLSADEGAQPKRRARPPVWPKEVRDVFFDDAREQLVGPRPDYSQVADVTATAGAAAAAPSDAAASWSKLIDAEVIEAEIKRLAQAVASNVATPSQFKGGGYKQCRGNFSMLAVLFAVAAEYDGAVRWADVAPALRDLFARAGYNCKVGTDQTYREAVQRSQALSDLIRGSRPPLASVEKAAKGGQVADRPPLMQRLEIAHQERLTKWLASEREFGRHRDEVHHEAQLMAVLAEVIGRDEFEYWEDEQYARYARELREAASDVAAAAEREDYEQARKAIGRATRACTECHEGYRG